ncbi:helix-turn-helix transcriptional regulator [Rubrivivax albus]|uniref:WYL domain-containing protein n=1 Tax=Rubrivivax albus TaxID=2499835 RepID=A0A3S2X036_9BURK|nr:WYL domain-containing protein [Rubrivivax albus]RVT50481.1 WYL domain-containing protein [Rubrivivax albus]
MTRTARLYRIERLIKAKGEMSFRGLIDELEISPATLKRDLAYLRDQLGAPIEYDRHANAYRFVTETRGPRHELPGLWFDEKELYSLLMAHQLLSELDGEGVLSRHLQPLLERIHGMLGNTEAEAKTIVQRVRIISAGRRPVSSRCFELVGEALVKRRRLQLRYLTRGRGEVTEREVSPQRLVHYRNTWYLDAWCHRSDGLRRFALDAVEGATLLETTSRDVAKKQLEAEMDGGYGIYAGSQLKWATIRFAPQAAAWVSCEQWHAAQAGRWLPDGSYELRVPFATDTEIAMDIMRHGSQVLAIEPASLREAVLQAHDAASRQLRGSALGKGVA